MDQRKRPLSQEPAREECRSVGREWVGRSQEEALLKRGVQSARTTVKEATASHAAGRGSASTTAKEASASNAVGRAP